MVLGQAARFYDPDAARGFVGGEVLAGPGDEVFFGGGIAGVKFYGGYGDLSFFWVGQTEGGGSGYGGMGKQGFFEFADVDGIAAGFDDIFDAAGETDEAEAIAGGEVAGAQPAVWG